MAENENPELPIYLPAILQILGWSRSKFFEKANILKEKKIIFYSKEAGSVRPRIKSYASWLREFQREGGTT